MRWTIRIEGCPRLVNHAAVTVGDRIFSFGGYCTGEDYRIKRPISIYVLNTHTYRWSELTDQNYNCDKICWPYQRYGHAVVTYEEKIYLFGGRNDVSPCNKLYFFDTRTYKWTQPSVSGNIPPELDGHSACVINGIMYLFGGYDESTMLLGAGVYCLDLRSPTTLTWRRIICDGDGPVNRDFHSATAIGNRMYIFGGRSDVGRREVYPKDVHYLDTSTERWHRVISTIFRNPSGRRSHTAVSLTMKNSVEDAENDVIIMFGGYNSNSNKHNADLLLFNPSDATWTYLKAHGSGPCPRRRQAMCRVGDRIFLFGGTSPYDGPRILFTAEQLAILRQNHHELQHLIDHNDMYVLDLNPSLRTLCLLQIIESDLSIDELPDELRREKEFMTRSNTISKPLRTLG